jgi:VWFA-related protein
MRQRALLTLSVLGFVVAADGWQDQPAPPAPGQLMIPTERQTLPPPPPDLDAFRVSSEVDLVLLDVAVTDPKNGGFVSNLKKDQFRIVEDKVEKPVKIFAAQDAPVTVGLVVDNSGSVRPKKPEIVTAALTFVTQSNPKDEIFVVNFNDRVFKGLPDDVKFTDDRALLRKALLTNPAQGRTALYDALKEALTHIEDGRLDKKTLILISDGGDNASGTERDEIMAMAERSLTTIYTVGIFNPDDKDKNPGFLKALARLTGGESYMPENIGHLVGICEKIAHDIRNRYTLGFTPGATDDGKRHAIRVQATGDDGRKLDVRTRTHYVAVARASRSRSEAK